MIVKDHTELSNILSNSKENLYFISFTQYGCPACSKLKVFLDKIEPNFKNKITFLNLDTVTFDALATQNKIEYVPTNILIKVSNKKVVWSSKKIVGLKAKEIMETLTKHA